MEMKIVTFNVRRPLTREELRIRKASRVHMLAGALAGAALVAAVALTVGMASGEEAEPVAPEIMPAAAVETVETPQEKRTWDVPLSETELAALLEACEAGRIAPELALGLIQVESSFRADAVNLRSGCYGYCQLNPRYFPSGLSSEDNIRTGIGYLAYQLERYDDLEAGLTAYNAGHDTGDRTYSDKVLAAAETFEGR